MFKYIFFSLLLFLPQISYSTNLLNKLYQKRFTLNQQGVPIVTIGITTGKKQIEITSNKGINIFTGGQGKIVFKGKTSLKLILKQGKKAKIKRYIVLESYPFNTFSSQKIKVQKKYKVQKKIKGFVISTGGKILDTRKVLFVVGPFSHKSAYKKLIIYRKSFPNAFIYEEMVNLPIGYFSITTNLGNVFLSNLSAVKITPLSNGKIYYKNNLKTNPYPGSFYVTIDKNGQLALINEISLETYIKGILPSEMFVSAPLEALKAQAIAAKGQVLSKMGMTHSADPFFLCNKVHCQVYKGLNTFHKRTNSAVKSVKGLFLFDKQGFPVDTVYHSACGGHTESNSNVWGGKSLPYLKGVWDLKTTRHKHRLFLNNIADFIKHPPKSYCSGAKNAFRWKVFKTYRKLKKSLKTYGIFGQIKKIQVLKRGISGRILALKIYTTLKTYNLKGELNIRRAFGGLKSSLFVTSFVKNGILFEGAGYGHGVGMCQWGAMGRALKGFNFKHILKHYYPNTILNKIY